MASDLEHELNAFQRFVAERRHGDFDMSLEQAVEQFRTYQTAL